MDEGSVEILDAISVSAGTREAMLPGFWYSKGRAWSSAWSDPTRPEYAPGVALQQFIRQWVLFFILDADFSGHSVFYFGRWDYAQLHRSNYRAIGRYFILTFHRHLNLGLVAKMNLATEDGRP